jgi:hypothetical protein
MANDWPAENYALPPLASPKLVIRRIFCSILRLGRMDTTLKPKQSFCSVAAWYSLVAPFAAIAVGWLNLALRDRYSSTVFDWTVGFVAWVLITSVLASITSLFGIRRHGVRVIVWKAAVAFVVSCCLFYLIAFQLYETRMKI